MIVQLVFPASLFAAPNPKAVVVVPVHDGVSDDISDDLTDAFSKALARQDLQVVSKDKVEAVLGYYQRAPARPEPVEGRGEAESALIRAKEHYYNFDYAEAAAQISRAISLMEANPKMVPEQGVTLRDAYVIAGLVEKSDKGRDETAKGYFRKALLIDPQYALDERAFSPSVVSLFSDVKREVSGKTAGSVSVDTDPKVAEVYLNGVMKGVTPIVISGLPEGSYKVAIKTNKYKPVERDVSVKAGDTVKLKEKLIWAASSKDESPAIHNLLTSPDEAREQIAEGVRIAELLRVPKVVMVDADEAGDGSGEVALRMIDREFKAGHNPIIVRYAKDKRNLVDNLAEATGLLVKQTKADILNNPTKNLDPDGIGDPVLLGKRKRALLALPVFWAVVGGLLAASAGGAAAAVVAGGGGGSSSTTGSVSVQFK